MVKIRINNDHFNFPSRWDELTREQLIRIAELSLQPLTVNEFKTKLLLNILGLSCLHIEEKQIKGKDETLFFFKCGKKNIYIISDIDIACLLQKLDFIFKTIKDKEGKEHITINSRLCANLIPSFSISGTEYIGPSASLTNLLFHEYIFSETNFIKFIETREEKYLNLLIAVLYRENSGKNPNDTDYNGDPRIDFNDFHLDARAERISPLDPILKTAILYFYEGCRNYLHHRFKEVFSSGSSSVASTDTFSGFMKLVTALTNNDITKNEQVRRSYLYEVMISLQEMMIQSNKAKEEIEKLKRKK